MITLEAIPVGPIGCNCVLAWDPETGTGVVVDPGGDANVIRAKVASKAFKVEALLHTHGHFDHLGATRELQDFWKCPAYLHVTDNFLVESLEMQTDLFGMPPVPKPVMTPMEAGQTYGSLTVRHTPGHSPGSCCLLGQMASGPFVLSGDTLFQGGVGRTDLLCGSSQDLFNSIQRQLYTLPDATFVLPGHGPTTTIGEEARTNPFLRRNS